MSKPGIKQKQKFSLTKSTAIFALFIGIIVYLWYSGLPKPASILLAIASLVIGGEVLMRVNKFTRIYYGIYMAKGSLGLNLMDRISRRGKWFWKGMADWGMVMGFGLFSLIIFRKDISKRSVAFGILSILFLLIVVLPYAILPFAFINIPQITSKIQPSAQSLSQSGYASFLEYVLYASSVLGGFVLYIIIALAYNAWQILYGISLAIVTTLTTASPNYTGLASSVAGVAPIIPGITIPLLPGILSLGLLLVVHEFSHGILARISKIKVKSSGTLMLGVIPIGAFVEPEEKAISKLGKKEQNRISSAGISANLVLSFIMFVPTVLFFYYVMPHFYQTYLFIQSVSPGSPAYNVLVPGSTILKWNGYNVSNVTSIQAAAKMDRPYENISILTSSGSYVITANQTGKVGVDIGQASRLVSGPLSAVASFLYAFISLSFLLNFLAGIVNLLPLPSLDGWRIFNTSIKSKRTVTYITALVITLLIINVLPWLWNL